MAQLDPKISKLLAYYRTHPYEYVVDILLAKPSTQQELILKAIPGAIQSRKGIAVKSGHGVGKAQTLDSDLIRFNGIIKMRDVKIGDKLINIDGNITKVIGIYPQGKKQIYKVIFNDGCVVKVSGEHLWETKNREERKRNKSWKIRTTLDIKKTLRFNNGTRKGLNHTVPNISPVKFKDKKLYNPYLIGAWIGDGCRNTKNISKPYEEFQEYISQNNENLYYKLRELNLLDKYSYDRFIPRDYLFSSVEQRIELLQGLLDTDGYINKNGSVFFCTTSEKLKNDIVFLVRSLGGFINKNRVKENPYYKKNNIKIYCRKAYMITINLPNNIIPFRLIKHKKNRVKSTTFRYRQRFIVDVIPDIIEECQCIKVDNDRGLYLTNDFIPTHNTCLAAWIIHWFMSTTHHPKVPCTAPTQHQLYDVLWSELKKWMHKSKFKDMFEWTATKFYNKKHPNTWFAVARTTNKPEGLQGFHAEHLLFIADEASGVPVEIHEVIEGSQTQLGSIYIMLGNPTQLSGGFYDAFHSKRAFYECFTLSTLDTAQERPEIADPNYGPKIAAKYGEDSDIYRVRVLGEFPRAESDTLISLDVAEKAAMRPNEFTGPYEVVEIGVDVARFGDDETTIYKRIGNVITKEAVLRKRDTMYVAGQVAYIVKKYHTTKTVYVNVDDSGVGGGVTDRLKELCETGELNATINGVNNGSRAFVPDLYVNIGTEMWFFMKQWLKTGSIENDEDLIAQLSTRRYKLSSTGKNQLERKEEMKNRGLVSPDHADGAILTLYSLLHAPKPDSNRSYAC